MTLKTLLTSVLTFAVSTVALSQTNVTKKYIENPDFGSRFAA